MSSSSGSAPPKKSQKKREQSASSHSALLDTPSGQDLGKTRTYVACKSCRTKKIKCLPGPTLSASTSLADGAPAFGTCQQCLQSNSECVYPATRDRAAYSRQYVQNLESRVQALEQLSGRLGPLLEAYERGALADLVPDPARHDGTAASADVRRANGLPSDARPDETDGAVGDETVDSGMGEEGNDADEEITGQLTQDDRGNYRWIGSSNTLSLLGEFHPQPHRNNSGHSQKSLQQVVGEVGVGAEAEDGDGGDESGGKVIFGPVAGSGVVMALPSVDEVNYPPPEAAEAMVEAFFHEVYPVLPLVLEYEFREEFAELMRRRKAGVLETMDKGFVSVVFAIFALGERVLVSSAAWHRERAKWNSGSAPSQAETILPGEAEAGVVWYERAEILHYSTVRDVTIRQVQCLTLLAAFQASVNAMPMAWLLAGQALRIGQDIGLPRATTFAMTLEQRQVAHRCWWSIYGLERLVSIALGRPLGVDDLDVDISYPLNVDDETLHRLSQQGLTQPPATYEEPPESTMSGFIALTKLCKIAGRVGQLLYRPSHGRSVADPKWAESQQASITKLHKAIRDWLAHDVPPKYKDPAASRPVQLVAATLSNCYFSILITLHRNFLPPSRDFPRPRPPPSSESLKHCVDAARSVIHVAAQSRVIVPPSHHLALFCQFLWSSAVILLLCEVQARDHVIEEAVAGQVESCRRVLQALEPVWPGSRKLKELLNDVETRAKEVVEAKENGEVAGAPDTKKRKSISRDLPVKPRPSSAMGARQAGRASSDASASPSSQDKRPRLHPTTTAGRYETSSMRDHPTSLAATSEATMPPYSAPLPNTVSVHPSAPQSYMSSPGFQGQPSANNGAFNFGSSTPSGTASNQFSAVAGTPGMGFGLDSFDLGGVTFDGLEMLQGFSGMDTASIWQAMSAAFLTDPQPTPGATTSYLHPSNHSTPASVSGSVSGSATANAGSMQPPTTPGHAQGPLGQPVASLGAPTPLWQHGAPGNSGGGWFMPGQGPRVGGGEGGVSGDGEWSQVAGNSFDWGADPTVPFNI